MIALSGCASVFLPGKQKISIKTGNPESTVYIGNEEVGTGSNVTAKVKKKGIQQVIVQTPDFKDEYYCLIPSRRCIAFWALQPLNFVTSFYGLYIDFANPKNKDYDKVQKLPKLMEYTVRPLTNKYIYLSAIKLNINDKKKDLKNYYLTYSKNIIVDANKVEKQKNMKEDAQAQKMMKKKGNKKTLVTEDDKIKYDDTKFSENISKILKKSGYVDTINKVFSDNNNTLVLEGSIDKLSTFTVYSRSMNSFDNYERIKVYMTWYIKNTYDEIIDSIQTQDFSGDFKFNWYNNNDFSTEYQNCVNDAVAISYLKLYENEEFNKYLKQDSSFKTTDALLTLSVPKQIVKEVSDAPAASVIVKTKLGHGSGFAITQDGYILTNYHVIAGKYLGKLDDPKVILSTGEEIAAKIVRYNRFKDIALLKVDSKFEKAFKLSNTKSFKNLQEVYTIGAPKSIELGQSVSLGLISNERKVNNNNLLQLSMSVNSGNSGGPLFDKSGVLHGVITSKLVGWSTEGVSFALPSYLISEYLNIKYN